MCVPAKGRGEKKEKKGAWCCLSHRRPRSSHKWVKGCGDQVKPEAPVVVSRATRGKVTVGESGAGLKALIEKGREGRGGKRRRIISHRATAPWDCISRTGDEEGGASQWRGRDAR